jgi:hypothetical protein
MCRQAAVRILYPFGEGGAADAMSKRKRTAVALAVLACVTLAGYLVVVWPSLMREPVDRPQGGLPQAVAGGLESTSGQFIGHTEASIVERFGPPTHRWRGHYGAPPASYQRTYPDAITVTYEGQTGTLYLSFCKEQRRFVCFSSDWLPAGWAF